MRKIASGQSIICGRCDKIAYGTYCIAVVVNLGWWCNSTLLMVFIELLYHPSFQIGYWIALIAIQARLRVPFSERPSVLFLAFNLYHLPQMHLYAFFYSARADVCFGSDKVPDQQKSCIWVNCLKQLGFNSNWDGQESSVLSAFSDAWINFVQYWTVLSIRSYVDIILALISVLANTS